MPITGSNQRSSETWYWDVGTLEWVRGTQPGAGEASGGLTDTQLRAADVKVTLDGEVPHVIVDSMPAGGAGLTDSELRAADVKVTLDGESVPVTGTFYQATQPVSLAAAVAVTDNSGSLTVDGTVAVSNATFPVTDNSGSLTIDTAQLPSTLVSGRLDVNIGASPNTLNVAMASPTVTFWGRASTFRTPGRAGTAGQKLLSLHNATGSTVTVTIKRLVVDLACTVVKAITVLPPVIRLWKVTVLPTNGTALTKIKIAGTGASSSSVTVLGDASADGTGSGTTLTATLPAGTFITQEFAPRFITGAGYEMADRIEFLGDTDVTLGALEGVVLFLDYTLATQNPTTDMWIAGIEWTEV